MTQGNSVVTIVRQSHLGGLQEKECVEASLPMLELYGRIAGTREFGTDEAAEIYLETEYGSLPREDIYREFCAVFPQADVFVRPTQDRKKRLFLSDMDSTVIGQECIDEIAYMLDIGELMSGITERAMRGEIDFADSLKKRVTLLKDAPVSLLEEVYSRRLHLSAGAARLIDGLKREGVFTVLVSGGFTFFAERFAACLGFDRYHANALEIADGKLTGHVASSPVLDAEGKRLLLERYAAELGIPLSQSMAVGDGANDVPMLTASGAGIAYRAKPATDAAAACRLKHNNLDALLYMLGCDVERQPKIELHNA
jgi:phosphoserine phosphatase